MRTTTAISCLSVAVAAIHLASSASGVAAYCPQSTLFGTRTAASSKHRPPSSLFVATDPSTASAGATASTDKDGSSSSSNGKKEGYVPKWTKKVTVAETMGSINDLGFDRVGLKGDIPVVFQQGNVTRTSMAWAGQPYRDVATQAGQFIKYGCGKGECGTCECMVNGKWIRPCIATVPPMPANADKNDDTNKLVVTIKAMKSKSTSSGTFFSIRSFFMGFWNNLLGMIGFVKFIKAAKLNWEERIEYEDRVRQRTKEIRQARLLLEASAATASA